MVREYLPALDEGRVQGGASGRRISPTDPAASYTAAHRARGSYVYSTHVLVDTDHGISVAAAIISVNFYKAIQTGDFCPPSRLDMFLFPNLPAGLRVDRRFVETVAVTSSGCYRGRP